MYIEYNRQQCTKYFSKILRFLPIWPNSYPKYRVDFGGRYIMTFAKHAGQLERQDPWDIRPKNEVTYFIEDESGRVKIGRSSSVLKRLSALQTSHPEKLTLVGVVDADELEVQHKFSNQHIRGEWFHLTQEILDWIEENGLIWKTGE